MSAFDDATHRHDDVRSTPPTGARLSGRGAAADLDELEQQDRRPVHGALDVLEHEVGLLERDLGVLVDELEPVLNEFSEGVSESAESVVKSDTSPLRERIERLTAAVAEQRNVIARVRPRLEV